MGDFLAEALLFLPIGLIGLFRWSAWVLKKVVGAYYSPERSNNEVPTVSVVTPVYKEDPQTFTLAIDSWLQNGPVEIIAVIDAEDEACTHIFKEKAREVGDPSTAVP